MERMIKAAKKLIKERKVKPISKGKSSLGKMYDVDGSTVRFFKKPGRTLITCTCQHGTRFCKSPTICKHKLAVIKMIMSKR